MSKQTIAIICGGPSSEHEVSCVSAGGVLKGLDRERFDPFLIGITKFTPPDLFNRTVFGINAIVLTFTWLIGEVVKFLKLRIHLPLPKQDQDE